MPARTALRALDENEVSQLSNKAAPRKKHRTKGKAKSYWDTFVLPPEPWVRDEKPFFFFGLPLEIRDEVYKLLAYTDELEARLVTAFELWYTLFAEILEWPGKHLHLKAKVKTLDMIRRTFEPFVQAHSVRGLLFANKQMRNEFIAAIKLLDYEFRAPYFFPSQRGKKKFLRIGHVVNVPLALSVGRIRVSLNLTEVKYDTAPCNWRVAMAGSMLCLLHTLYYREMLEMVLDWFMLPVCYVQTLELTVVAGNRSWRANIMKDDMPVGSGSSIRVLCS